MPTPASRSSTRTDFKALCSAELDGDEIFSRHFHGKGPYRLVNGLKVSASFVELFTEPLKNRSTSTSSARRRSPACGPRRSRTARDTRAWISVAIGPGTRAPASMGKSGYTDPWWIEVSTEVVGARRPTVPTTGRFSVWSRSSLIRLPSHASRSPVPRGLPRASRFARGRGHQDGSSSNGEDGPTDDTPTGSPTNDRRSRARPGRARRPGESTSTGAIGVCGDGDVDDVDAG
jgi:hypothetical protein